MKFVFILAAFLSTFSLVSADTPKQEAVQEADQEIRMEKRVSFTLRNNSLKSIPLLIPNVMNPNLSPKSNSGVTLAIGQEILFKYKGKRRVLLTVSEDLEGRTLDVAKVLKRRKQEIDDKKAKKRG